MVPAAIPTGEAEGWVSCGEGRQGCPQNLLSAALQCSFAVLCRDVWTADPHAQNVGLAGRLPVMFPFVRFSEFLLVLQVLHTPTVDASQLAVRGWSIEAALSSSPLTHAPVSLADVERRLAVADPALWQDYQVQHVWHRGGEGGGASTRHP